ncbi:hypothetical protein F2Q70_00042614 [Brassica cretica]|uniref:Uncharacterized protein n=1 Tax=Brassica cretica TaxID=69181 RepID=A0A8S9KGZ0_BRACR|nr:hypothetical protein F2Q70_00042614 [Brassica cretica]
MARASAIQGEETKSCAADPLCSSFDAGSVKIQAKPANWIPPFDEASVLQEISIEFSADAYHRGVDFARSIVSSRSMGRHYPGQMKESRAPRMLGLRPRMWLLSSGLEGQKV